MPPRAFTAVALLTAALAGTVAAQPAPGPADTGPFFPTIQPPAPGFSAAPGPAPVTATPGGYPVGGPAAAYPPGVAYPGPGPALPTDSLGGAVGGTTDAFGPNCWVGVEYLFFRSKSGPLNTPLATASPAGGLALLGARGTQVVLGGQDFRFKDLSGVRVVAGGWFTDAQTVGIEANAFILPEKHAIQGPVVATGDLPVLARPFFDPTINRQNVRLLSSPGLFAGGIGADASSQVWGAELASVLRCWQRGCFTLDGLVGFKFLSLEESLQINDFSNSLGGTVNFAGRSFLRPAATYTEDRIGTFNHFYGGLIGLRGSWHVQAFTFSLTGKLGIGSTNETVTLDGSTSLVGPLPTPITAGGGFFATTNNPGRFTQSSFAVAPEGSFQFSAQITRHVSVNAGYTFIYLSRVVRPGDQLPTTIPPNQIVTSPTFGSAFRTGQLPVTMNQTDFFTHGLNIGFSYGF
jgi:hypothetical protein